MVGFGAVNIVEDFLGGFGAVNIVECLRGQTLGGFGAVNIVEDFPGGFGGCEYRGMFWRVNFGWIWGSKDCGGFSGWIWGFSVPREFFMDGIDFAWREIF